MKSLHGDLLKNLVLRELKARYGTLTLGYLWSVLNPLIFTLILFFLFSKVVKLGIKNYPLYVLTGLLPWNFFQNGLTSSLRSVSNNANLFSKVYFPRHYVILSSVIVSLILFLFDFIVIVPFLVYYRVSITEMILLFPVSVLFLSMMVYGLSLLFSIVVIYFRDFNFILQFVLRIGFYVTPIFYNIELLPQKYRGVYALNPLVGIIEGVRFGLYGEGQVRGIYILYSLAFAVFSYLFGRWVFNKWIPEAVKIL